MSSRINVLHVDDDPDFGDLVATFLNREDDAFEVHSETEAQAGLSCLAAEPIDCVVSDFDMPQTNGIQFLESVRETHEDLPFILFTGKGSEEIASDAISAGVSDYLQKSSGTDQYTVLANRIKNLVSQHRAEESLQARIEQQRFVSQLGQEALAGGPLEDLFNTAVEGVAEILDTDFAKVLDYEPEAGHLVLQAGVGWEGVTIGESSVNDGDDSQAGYTLRSAEPVIVEDLTTETRFSGPDLLIDHDVVSGISVIIGDERDPWGVFGTHTTEAQYFSEDDVVFVQNVANVLAAAIQRQEREARLQEVTRELHGLLDTIEATVWMRDRDSRFITVNQNYYEMFDIDQTTTVIGQRPSDILPAAIATEFERNDQTVIENEAPLTLEETIQTSEGMRTYLTRVTPLFDDGELYATCGIATDITEQKERERRIQAERDRFSTLLDHLPMPVIHTHIDGSDPIIQQVNPAFEETFGYDSEAVIDESIDDIIVPPDRRSEGAVLNEQVAEEGHVRAEVIRQAAEGLRTFLMEAVIHEVDSGEREGFAIYTDITDQKDRELHLQTIIDNLPGYVYRHAYEPEYPLEFVKGDAESVTGYTAEELTDDIILAEEVIHPDDREWVWEDHVDGIEENGTYDIIYRILTKDDEVRWIRDQGQLVTDPVTGDQFIDGFVIEVTNEHQFETE